MYESLLMNVCRKREKGLKVRNNAKTNQGRNDMEVKDHFKNS